jgi:hypothetical protein
VLPTPELSAEYSDTGQVGDDDRQIEIAHDGNFTRISSYTGQWCLEIVPSRYATVLVTLLSDPADRQNASVMILESEPGKCGRSRIGCDIAVASAILRKYPRAEGGSGVRPVASAGRQPEHFKFEAKSKAGGTRA